MSQNGDDDKWNDMKMKFNNKTIFCSNLRDNIWLAKKKILGSLANEYHIKEFFCTRLVYEIWTEIVFFDRYHQ